MYFLLVSARARQTLLAPCTIKGTHVLIELTGNLCFQVYGPRSVLYYSCLKQLLILLVLFELLFPKRSCITYAELNPKFDYN